MTSLMFWLGREGEIISQRQHLIKQSKASPIAEIQAIVSEHYKIDPIEMRSARRSRVVARPRQVAMYIAKTLTKQSLPEIGRRFGGRDHTTVIHAIRTITDLNCTDPKMKADVAELLERLTI